MMKDFSSIDLLWVLLCAGQVLLMQAGFCLLESGTSRAKNSINVAIKNLVDVCVSALSFWIVGFGLMYGQSVYGWFGSSHFLIGGDAGSGLIAFFLFQVVFCGTATTIISGAVAERIRFRSYVIVSVIVSAVVYPVFGHWAWGGVLSGTGTGWLASLGFIDFAGSTVVHSVGAWVALAAVLVVGPRMGRYGKRARPIQSSNLPMVVLGVIILWFGWLGFNGGSGLELSERVPMILLNTVISAAAGGMMSLVVVMVRLGRPDVSLVGNGVIAGLVAVTAGCHVLTPVTSLLVGMVASLVCLWTTDLLNRVGVDDVIGAIPAHGFAGIWGTICIPLLSDPGLWGTGNDWMTQLAIQCSGCGAAFGWAFGFSIIALGAVNLVYPLRVPRRHEYIGLNIAEHQANSELQDLLTQMSRHRKGREYSHRVKVEPFTEIGQVAAEYNRVISEVDCEIAGRLEAQERYQGIFDNAVEGIFQTNPDGSFRSANPAMAELCGYDSPEQLCQSVSNVASDVYVEPDTRDRFLREIAIQGRVSDFQSQLKRPDGSSIWVSENARAVRREDGQLLYFEGTLVDITQRLAAEQLRLQKEQAESASNAKSDFLAGMSHEMRTPLNGIVSMLDLMGEGELSEQQTKHLQIARRSSTTLLTIINDILDLSKIEAGKLELESVAFSLIDLVDETVEMLYHRAKAKGLHLAAHFEVNVPEIIIGDPVRLQQVLINLISNAIKFTSEGGVSLRVRRFGPASAAGVDTAGHDASVPRLCLEVIDTGIGIPAERQAKVFEPFTQADASTTRRFGGTGLGLNICKQLVVAMGGDIEVDSELDVGSTFSFVIPYELPDSNDSGLLKTNILQQRNHSAIAGKQVVLIAPQNAETDVIRDYLERWSAECVFASSVDAVDSVLADFVGRGRDADLLIADSEVLSKAAGGSLPKSIREIKRRILIGDASCDLDADSVLSQPLRPSELLEAIETSLNGIGRVEKIRKQHEQAVLDSDIGDGRTVLVVDDNEINTIVASELLQRLGFESETVSSGQAAIERAKRRPYDLILMDCEMPVMDGFDTTRELRRLHQSGRLALSSDRPLRIIALTAQALAGQVERCFRSGMNAHLAKPISRVEFTRTLKEIFSADPLEEPGLASELGDNQPTKTDLDESIPVINWREVVQRCGESESTSLDVTKMFKEQLPSQFEGLRESILAGDSEEAQARSHRLKGVAATMSADSIARLAGKVEIVLRTQQTSEVGHTLEQLEIEVDRCMKWIDEKLAEATK